MTGSFVSVGRNPNIKMNGRDIFNNSEGLFSVKFLQDSQVGNAQVVSMRGDVDFILEKISMSDYGIEPQLISLKDQFVQGIDFSKDLYPDFLKDVSGVSGQESWGRWTDANLGSSAKFYFKKPLPRNFILELHVPAIGPNVGARIVVRVDGIEKTFVMGKTAIYTLAFKTDGTADTIEIIPPHLFIPHEIDPQNIDMRKLGIALVSLKIK